MDPMELLQGTKVPRLRLSARGVVTLKTDRAREEFWDTVTPGLILRVSGESGAKTWSVRYRLNGRRRRQKLGNYPSLSLAAARAAARDVQRQADAGEDPAQQLADRKGWRAGESATRWLSPRRKRGDRTCWTIAPRPPKQF